MSVSHHIHIICWQATPKAKEFRKKGCDHYDKLGILFNKTTATRLLAFASTEDPTNTEEERELDEQYRYGGIHVNVDAGSDDEAVQVPPNMGKVKHPTHEEKGKEKKPKKVDKISDMAFASVNSLKFLGKSLSVGSQGQVVVVLESQKERLSGSPLTKPLKHLACTKIC